MHSNRKLRVLQTIRQGKIGGGESHVLDLVACLDRERYEPVVLSFTDGPMMQALAHMEVPHHVIQSEKAFDIRVWMRVKRYLREQRIDIVHVHGTRANTNVLWAARSLGLPLIYTVHGWSFHEGLPWLQRVARQLAERFITRQTKLNIAVSVSNYETGLQALGGFNAVVIHNGVNLQKFNPQARYENIRRAYGIAEHEVVIGYIVRVTGQKDPLGMIRAFAQAVRLVPHVRLLMVGEGDLKAAAQALAQELELGDRVIFDNFRQDVPALLNGIDIYCLPSLWEGFPIGVLEAMAMGKAVVASYVDGTREAITHGENGLLVPPKDDASLAQALVLLATDESLRQRLQLSAARHIREKYDVRRMTEKIAAVYEQVAAAHIRKDA